ncbi:hypothetical protein SAMN05421856_10581 [Chryseobacterium taichungense]|uniref:Uncharacterized protein n=1 Tax=Chryseobacterium taichungense TaxID=295069 RepID=A0A1H8A397_9FLAO|nr:hypothetical protein [Chryseobacterium taichungense]SEM65190.1 hypothetical protein SAMN05421856_10581 [Chryseobacterium taichungense]
MSIDRNTSEIITLNQAVEYTHAFQENNPDSIRSFFAGIDKINLILEQEKCIGIRIYNGYDTKLGKNNLVLIGVDTSGEDIINGVILEHLTPCPTTCPKSSPLVEI